MKTNRTFLLLLALLLCLSPFGLAAQSNVPHDYASQRKNAEKYQKHLKKQQRKQDKAREKTQEKTAKAYRKQHQ